MKDKMTLLFLRQTNQVLAALTRVAVPESAVPKGNESEDQKNEIEVAELKILVGDNLFVRDLPVKLPAQITKVPQFIKTGRSFPSADLGVLTLDLDAAVLMDSRKYVINSDNKPQLSFDPSGITFSADTASITIELPAAVTVDTGVWVQVYLKDVELQTLICVIKKNDPDPHNKKNSISVQLSHGDTYQFLTSVAGYKPIIYERTV